MDNKCQNCRNWFRVSEYLGNCPVLPKYIGSELTTQQVNKEFGCVYFDEIQYSTVYRYDLNDWSTEFTLDKIGIDNIRSISDTHADIVIFIDNDGQSKLLKNKFNGKH